MMSVEAVVFVWVQQQLSSFHKLLFHSPSPKSNNTPAIIGGVVGGAVGLGLIIYLIIYVMKRKSSKVPPSTVFSKDLPTATPTSIAFDPAAFGFTSKTASPTSPTSSGPTSDTDSGYNANTIYQNGHARFSSGGSSARPPFSGPDWSLLAPNSGPYSYTLPPPKMDTKTKTKTNAPPPGSLGSGWVSLKLMTDERRLTFNSTVPSMVQYSHARTNSDGLAYNPNPNPQQSITNPYGPSANRGKNGSYHGVPEV